MPRNVEVAITRSLRRSKATAEAVAPNRAMKFYTPTKLGKNQALTKEGFLLCSDVAIGRIGDLMYGPGESPITPGRDGVARVSRDAAEVFRPETLASFEGKPVTNDHPPDFVTPDNYKEYTVGVVQNVRRGENPFEDFVFADLLIQDKEAINAVRDGKREVSCGYDADYEETGPGRGRQLNIIGNHVALVDQGRCGSRCAIQDRSMIMTKKLTVAERLLAAFKAKDATQLAKVMDDAELGEEGAGESASGVQVHVHNYGEKGEGKDDAEGGEKKPDEKEKDKDDKAKDDGEGGMSEKLDKILACLEKMAGGAKDDAGEEGDGEQGEGEQGEKMTGDAATKHYRAVAANAEILVPGFKMPTFDGSAKTFDAKKFRDMICQCKRKVMAAAFTGDARAVLTPLLAGVDLEKASCDTVNSLFSGSSAVVKMKNNQASARTTTADAKDAARTAPMTPAELNKRNNEFWNPTRTAH